MLFTVEQTEISYIVLKTTLKTKKLAHPTKISANYYHFLTGLFFGGHFWEGDSLTCHQHLKELPVVEIIYTEIKTLPTAWKIHDLQLESIAVNNGTCILYTPRN